MDRLQGRVVVPDRFREHDGDKLEVIYRNRMEGMPGCTEDWVPCLREAASWKIPEGCDAVESPVAKPHEPAVMKVKVGSEHALDRGQPPLPSQRQLGVLWNPAADRVRPAEAIVLHRFGIGARTRSPCPKAAPPFAGC